MHYNVHNFNDITMHILDIVKSTNENLYYENLFIHDCKTAFPYDLNQLFNNSQVPSLSQRYTKLPKVTIYSALFHNNMHTCNNKSNRTKRGNKINIIIIHDIHDWKHNLHVYLQDFSNNFNISNLKIWICSLIKNMYVKFMNILRIIFILII